MTGPSGPVSLSVCIWEGKVREAFTRAIGAAILAVAACSFASSVSSQDACDQLAWLKEEGSKGLPGAQAMVAIIYGFDITACHTVVRGDPRNDVRAYAWLTPGAQTAIVNMDAAAKAEMLSGLVTVPTSPDPGIQAFLDDPYADRSGIDSLDDLRPWLRSRMTAAQVEDALELRATLMH